MPCFGYRLVIPVFDPGHRVFLHLAFSSSQKPEGTSIWSSRLVGEDACYHITAERADGLWLAGPLQQCLAMCLSVEIGPHSNQDDIQFLFAQVKYLVKRCVAYKAVRPVTYIIILLYSFLKYIEMVSPNNALR